MKLSTYACIILAGLILLGHTTELLAGNKWMMEKNADELIMLNTMLLKRLGTIEKDGKIILSGDVIHKDGKVIVKLHELRQIGASGEENILSSETFDTNLPYHIFLREETLSEIPAPTEKEQ